MKWNLLPESNLKPFQFTSKPIFPHRWQVSSLCKFHPIALILQGFVLIRHLASARGAEVVPEEGVEPTRY
jgi:hypothetical protein